MPIRKTFDRAYYSRFYGDAAARRAYRREEERLGDFVCAYLEYLGQPVRNVVDIGCGLGQWRGIVAKHFPKASYTGVEQSEYLCRRYGWEQGSAVDFRARTRFDLVICKDTLQYLPAEKLEAAVANLAALGRGACYLSVLTREDWDERCDRRRTDGSVHLRSADWYRKRFAQHFTNVGGGLHLCSRSEALPWELETLPARRA
jgi:trans-aconitate methyltransferase